MGLLSQIPWTGWLKEQTFISHSSEGLTSEGCCMLRVWGGSSSWLSDFAAFWLCPQVVERAQAL